MRPARISLTNLEELLSGGVAAVCRQCEYASRIRRQCAAWLFSGFLLIWPLFIGCAGYRLGPANGMAAGEKSIQVNPFINQTLQPRLTDAVTAQMRKELQRDRTYQLSTHGDPDIFMSGTLTSYQRQEVTLAFNDVLTVRDFRLTLTAHVLARDRATGKVLLDQSISGHTLIRVGSDLPSAERQALPLLAGDLARNVTALLTEGAW